MGAPARAGRALALLLCACGGGRTPLQSSPYVTIEVDRSVIGAGESATVRWTAPQATSCKADGAWAGGKPSSGTETVTPGAPGAYRFVLNCDNVGASSTELAVLTRSAEMVPLPAPASTGACDANCLYVDAATGSDANDGRSRASAFRTLARAAREVGPGSTVLVMSGTYTSDGTTYPLMVTTSGTPDAWITFAAAPGERPVIQIPRGAWAGIYLPGVAYVIIDGFEVVGQGQSITVDEAERNDGTQPELNQACIYVDGAGHEGFRPGIPHDIVIRNNTVRDCSSSGIGVTVADSVTIANNHVHDNAWWTIFGTSGITVYRLTDAPGAGTIHGYRNFIVGNRVHGNRNNIAWMGGNPAGIFDGNGIIVDDTNHTQPQLGPWDLTGVPYGGRTYVANNVVYDNGGRGIHAYASAHVDIVNNTAWNNLLTDSPFILHGEISTLECQDVNLLNNVAANGNGKEASHDDGQPLAHNLWAGSNVPARGVRDLVADPRLADPTRGDFSPGPGSPALATGTDALAPTTDIAGRPRPQGRIDRGAIQVSE